jgi:hypothetical protein
MELIVVFHFQNQTQTYINIKIEFHILAMSSTIKKTNGDKCSVDTECFVNLGLYCTDGSCSCSSNKYWSNNYVCGKYKIYFKE